MISAFILSIAVLGADDPAAPDPALAEYRAAVAQAGKNADAQVRLALWCESHGLTAERLKHLSLAVLYEPKNSLARGLMGLVAYQGKWEHPEQVSQEVQDDPEQKARIKEYLQRRTKAPDRAGDQWKLALWCEQNGLKEQAIAHLHRVVQLDPKRESAWKHLGFKRVGARWIKPDEAAAAKVEAQRQKKANNHWRPILERLRTSLQSKDASRRAEAEKALAQITDRRAAPMVWATFGRGKVQLQKVAVQVLGQIDDAGASRSLVILAVFGGSADVRRLAIETLRRRDAREFAGFLIAMIQKPIKYKVKRVGGPGMPGELFIEGGGSTPNLKRIYSPPPIPTIPLQPGDRVSMDANGLPVINRTLGVQPLTMPVRPGPLLSAMATLAAKQQANVSRMLSQAGVGNETQRLEQIFISMNEDLNGNGVLEGSGATEYRNNLLRYLHTSVRTHGPVTNMTGVFFNSVNGVSITLPPLVVEVQQSAAVAQQQLQIDVAAIDEYNQSLSPINSRVTPVLSDIAGQDLGPDPFAWQKWFNNLVGYNSSPMPEPPTVTENVPLVYQPQPISIVGTVRITADRVSCFGAGTMVRTLAGSAPIDSLKLGDQVLTQSIKTGALAYKPILVVHHNPPSKTFEIKLGDETIVSSYFHRFWKAGAGWVMARDLKVGDPIRTLNGTVQVTAIEDGKVVPVFNLDVADDADFFVGEVGALAHDNTVPNFRETPFDAVATAGHSDNSSRTQAPGEGKP